MKRRFKINVLATFVLITCLILGGCSAADESASEGKYASATASYNDDYYVGEPTKSVDQAEVYADLYDSDVSMESGSAVTGVTFAENKKIIYQSNVVMETMVYNETYARLLELINKYGGYIESESYNNQLRSYLKDNSGKGKLVISTNDLTIRIPSKNYSSFMTEGLSLGNVLSRNQSITDKTNEYNTNRSYVDILNEEAEYLDKQLKQLSDELKNAEASYIHYDDIISNMKDIAARKAQVEKELVPYQRTLDDIDEKVDYSTITMELREVNEYTIIEEEIEEETFGSQIKKSWKNAMNGLADMFKSFFLFLIDFIPTFVGIILLGIVAFFIWRIIRRIIKKKKAKKAAKAQNTGNTVLQKNPAESAPAQATAGQPQSSVAAPENAPNIDLNNSAKNNSEASNKNK